MATKIEKSDTAFNAQLKNFANKLANYNTLLGVSAADLTAIRADSIAFDYVMSNQELVQNFAHNYTHYHEQLRNGGSTTLGPLPVLLPFAAAPLMPGANIEARFRMLIQRIIHSPNYTNAIGQDLRIVGPINDFNPNNGKPVFSIEKVAGGHPQLFWTKGKYQAVEIWKDSGQGFLKLHTAIQHEYMDTTPLPAMGLTATWTYKMIYLLSDAQVGSWSDAASITVSGEV